MTKYGRSPWLDQFPKSRIPSHPKHRGDAKVDVVVVGGGLTGCASAYALAAAGVKTVLLEGGQLGRGTTAFSSGWIADEPAVPFHEVENAIGLRNARRAWQAWRRAALDFAALLRRLDIRCNLEPHGAITIAAAPEQTTRMSKDHKARKSAGLDVSAINARAIKAETALDAVAGLRSREGATIDPYRACLGLAAAAADRNAQLFERSPVRRITFTRKDAKVFTAGGSIHTRRIVIATGLPAGLFQSLARHFWFHTSYLVLTAPIPARIRHQLGNRKVVVRDSAAPPHVVRWVGEDRLLIEGADSAFTPPRLRSKVAIQRTGQLMYELSTLYPDVSGTLPEYGWMTDYARTEDGLPYIGVHRNFPHHLFAFGNSSHSVTAAYLASRILLRQCSEEMDPADAAFGFHR
jgi:glycine/D-amino acid oxidase-like deaminating enzyme